VIARAPCDLAVSATTHKLLNLGRISGLFGVKGWVKVNSYTEPRDNVVGFRVWTLRLHGADSQIEVEEGRSHGKQVVAKLRGVDDRDRARAFIGADILIERERLPPCAVGEYYWIELEGLEVRTLTGEVLGIVDHLLATGTHDVLVLTGERERLIPFVLDRVIRNVDLAAGLIVADWSPDY
jgi:16S rRNA processing protein RimM